VPGMCWHARSPAGSPRAPIQRRCSASASALRRPKRGAAGSDKGCSSRQTGAHGHGHRCVHRDRGRWAGVTKAWRRLCRAGLGRCAVSDCQAQVRKYTYTEPAVGVTPSNSRF
jgi:hypothetical protein